MGNESSTEVVQDEAKFLEGLQGMCVSLPWLLGRSIVGVACMFVLVRRSLIYLLCHTLLLYCGLRFGGISQDPAEQFMHALICSHIPIRFIIRLALIRSLDDPDVKAVDEQVNAGIGVPVSYLLI